jgi:hypothetical protein
MSFDLYFAWRKRERIDFNEVVRWSEQIANFTRNPAQLWYKNALTGVYFSIDFDDGPPKPEGEGIDVADGYFDTALSFNLNFIRPSYFAFEAMPVIEQLVSKFGLYVINPQDHETGPASGRGVTAEALIRSWLQSHERAILMLLEHSASARPFAMPAPASLYLRRYQKSKTDLERSCGEDIFVPSLLAARRKSDSVVGRAITYTESLPTIVPECEWVFLVRRKKGLLQSKKDADVSVISSATFRQALETCLKPFTWQSAAVEIIEPKSAASAGRIISRIERTIPKTEFEVVALDSFIDVEVAAPAS